MYPELYPGPDYSIVLLLVLGFIFIVSILSLITSFRYEIYGWFLRIGKRIKKIGRTVKKRNHDNFIDFNFNPLIILFGVPAILIIMFFEGIWEWYQNNKGRFWLIFINITMLTPLFLLMFGVIHKLPELFVVVFCFYILIMLGVLASRRELNHYNNNYNRYPTYNNNNNNSYRSKPKPKGITKVEATRRKQKIRTKLSLNKELKKKYQL